MRLLLTLVSLLLAPAAGLIAGSVAAVTPTARIAHRPAASRATPLTMGNNAPDGPFTPVVLAGKVVLGEKVFNKVRGKGIQIHSQIISEFCTDYGVSSKMRGGLIKKAKNVGGLLGFLS